MKLTNNCFAVLGLGYSLPWTVNSGFITGADKTLIVDSGPSYLAAQTIYGYAKNIKPGNELIVVNTEKHFDHIGGNCFFKEKGIKIYGHESVERSDLEFKEELEYFNANIENQERRACREEKIFFEKTKIVNPDFNLEDGQVFLLGGGVEAEIIFTPGHTASNISVYIEKEKIFYCGDLVVNGYLPNLEAGSKEDWMSWKTSLEKISNYKIEYIVPGHGFVISGKEVEMGIERMERILENSLITGIAPTQQQ